MVRKIKPIKIGITIHLLPLNYSLTIHQYIKKKTQLFTNYSLIYNFSVQTIHSDVLADKILVILVILVNSWFKLFTWPIFLEEKTQNNIDYLSKVNSCTPVTVNISE